MYLGPFGRQRYEQFYSRLKEHISNVKRLYLVLFHRVCLWWVCEKPREKEIEREKEATSSHRRNRRVNGREAIVNRGWELEVVCWYSRELAIELSRRTFRHTPKPFPCTSSSKIRQHSKTYMYFCICTYWSSCMSMNEFVCEHECIRNSTFTRTLSVYRNRKYLLPTRIRRTKRSRC